MRRCRSGTLQIEAKLQGMDGKTTEPEVREEKWNGKYLAWPERPQTVALRGPSLEENREREALKESRSSERSRWDTGADQPGPGPNRTASGFALPETAAGV